MDPRRLWFRWQFCYWSLFLIPVFELLWAVLVPWVGAHVLALPDPVVDTPTGSGDRTWDWVRLVCQLGLATIAALAWSVLRPAAAGETRLAAAQRIGMRYALAFVMLGYGFGKVFPLQFLPPNELRLLDTFGSASPMGLLWTFMGQSPAYEIFTGLAEVAGGMLLFSRRTTTLGALVVAAVMANVVMLNFCYDVPVKINSTHWLLLAITLIAPDARRLWSVLVRNEPGEPRVLREAFRSARRRRAWIVGKSVVIVLVVVATGLQSLLEWLTRASTPPGRAFAVERQIRDDREVPAPVVDPSRLRHIGVGAHVALLVAGDGSEKRYVVERGDGQLTLRTPEGEEMASLSETALGDDRIRWTGTLEGTAIDLTLAPLSSEASVLRTRGFHWVTEVPFNR